MLVRCLFTAYSTISAPQVLHLRLQSVLSSLVCVSGSQLCSGRLPFHSVGAGDAIVSPQGVHVPIHLQHTQAAAGAAEGRHLTAPLVCFWVVPV